jgi:hypothetical protein
MKSLRSDTMPKSKVIEKRVKKVQDRKISHRYERRKEKVIAQEKRAERLQGFKGIDQATNQTKGSLLTRIRCMLKL